MISVCQNTPSNEQLYQVKSKLITMSAPVPYGSIPKRRLKKQQKEINKTPRLSSAPYPFFSTPASSSFFSFINKLFKSECKDRHVGFMPRSTPTTTEAHMSQLEVMIPASHPIDCAYNHSLPLNTDNSSFSSSGSSSCSAVGSFTSIMSHHRSSPSLSTSPPFNTTHTHHNNNINNTQHEHLNTEESIRYHLRNSCIIGHSISTDALSDILCDHYVHNQQMLDPVIPDNKDVPLETFKVFEAPSQVIDQWFIGQPVQTNEAEWKLVDKNGQPIIVIEEPVIEEVPDHHHVRDIRANAAYLRMIVAEVNMMRSQKIVGPLRPRRLLPKRTDIFMHRSSPLQLIIE
ncbi:hypothetical protein BDB01DRAFT_894375 [Pilobolus umbonatus]|nr:hypothetical protein BDB01DRAFT_894375 [Pilobolus umbonatus]